MKTLTIFILLIAACVISVSATQSQPSRWEYRFIYQCDEKKTNSLALEGWELTDMSMAAYGSIGVATCVFKRPKS